MWRCLSIQQSTTLTLFLFLSPQFFVNHRDSLDVFVKCTQKGILRLIAMDEAHIHVQHGTSFRDDICALHVEFFRRIYGNQPSYRRPRLIALSATFPTSYLWLLSSLLTVDFTIDNCVLKGPEQEFSQREIEMKLEVCGQKSVFISKELSMVTEFLDQNRNSSVIIFCKSLNQSLHLSSHLNKKLDLAKLFVDVLNINGSLDKMEKFWRIRLICDNCHSPKGNFRALVTTNTSNVRIDKQSIS